MPSINHLSGLILLLLCLNMALTVLQICIVFASKSWLSLFGARYLVPRRLPPSLSPGSAIFSDPPAQIESGKTEKKGWPTSLKLNLAVNLEVAKYSRLALHRIRDRRFKQSGLKGVAISLALTEYMTFHCLMPLKDDPAGITA
ncbi:hypothetical protein B0H16DRAFT_1475039 [Mycena metata]|uniref:Uncharacterized protein n=1 Tax=Mycena metata TaxID=1033252 RepID=A0AAD7HGI9_9AGAR|nr:hypothetical protein B0H16DRAFT_1475039 [Mycena metata]